MVGIWGGARPGASAAARADFSASARLAAWFRTITNSCALLYSALAGFKEVKDRDPAACNAAITLNLKVLIYFRPSTSRNIGAPATFVRLFCADVGPILRSPKVKCGKHSLDQGETHVRA
jgi:hypothetical protein